MLNLKKKSIQSLLAVSLCFSFSAGNVNAASVSQAAEDLIADYPDMIEQWTSVPNLDVSEDDIKDFVSAVSSKVEASGGVTEENIGSKFKQAFEEVALDPSYTEVIMAAAVAFDVNLATREIPAGLQPLKDVVKSDLLEKVETPATSSPGSSGGGGGGGGTSLAKVKIEGGSGATLSFSSSSLVIPAGAFSNDVTVTVEKVANTSGLLSDLKAKFLSQVIEISKDNAGNMNKPATLTLTFDTTGLEVQNYQVGLYGYDSSKSSWTLLTDGVVDLAVKKAKVDINQFTKFAVIAVEKTLENQTPAANPVEIAKNTDLQDIKGHWAEPQIRALVEKGAINGYPNGAFKAGNSITRAEFATVLVKAFGLKVETGKVFADTSSHWAKDFVATAFAHGIVNGLDANHFAPDDLITREQMAVMIAKATKLDKPTKDKEFADQTAISPWAKESITAAVEKEIIKGYPNNTFKAKGKTTRAEAVTAIYNALK